VDTSEIVPAVPSTAVRAPARFRVGFGALLVAALLASGCATHHRAAAPKRTPKATTTTTTPKDITTIATATVPQVQVYLTKPGADDPSPTTTAPPAPARVAPIPRAGFASAGVSAAVPGPLYANPTYFKNPLVFDVVAQDGDWLQVALLARPNGQTGWVRRSDVSLSTTQYHLALQLSTFTLQVLKADKVVTSAKVVIGTPSTPTPLGTFYVTEKIQRDPAGAYGPWILATSAYSEALESFDGGLPQVAFHGTNRPALLGTQASNGCVRMPDDVDAALAYSLPAGTPITITA
jgi:lipoprotein-anchoring transpeptidase ErfK/SrfK